jgi:hypothetical protein
MGNFVSKGGLVWNKLTKSERLTFLYKNFTPEITPRSQEILAGKSFKFLPKNVKIKFEAFYANIEEYAKGGGVGGKNKKNKSNLVTIEPYENSADEKQFGVYNSEGILIEDGFDEFEQAKTWASENGYEPSGKMKGGGNILGNKGFEYSIGGL